MSDDFERELREHLRKEAGQVSNFPRHLSARVQERIAGHGFSLFQQLMLAGAMVVFVGLLAVGIAHLKGLNQVSPLGTPKPSPSFQVTPTVVATPSAVAFTCTPQVDAAGGSAIVDGNLTRVQAGNHESSGYDRVTFEFASALPSYTISRPGSQQYMLDPIGTTVAVAGTDSVVIKFTGTPTIAASVAADQKPGLQAVAEIRRIAGGFEGHSTFAIGLNLAPCIKITELISPSRLVIDFGTTPPPAPSANYQFRASDMSYVDAQHGFAIGTACNQALGKCGFTAIAHTTDGGATWHDTPGQIGSPNNLYRIHFQTPAIGWVYGQSLWETRDGGNSWKAVMNLPIMSVDSTATTASAIVQDCPQQGCQLRLYVSSLQSGDWLPAATQPAVSGSSAQITMVSDSTGWILVWNGPQSAASQLVVTHDGGVSWQSLIKPCADATSLDDQMAALPDGTLWIVCGGDHAAGQQRKQFITSTDGGVHWSFPPDFALSGYVSQLAALSSTTGWAAFYHGQLFSTTDGGRHWTAADSRGVPSDGAGAGFQGLQFVDSQHGWIAQGSTLYRTTDGGAHWTSAPFVMTTP